MKTISICKTDDSEDGVSPQEDAVTRLNWDFNELENLSAMLSDWCYDSLLEWHAYSSPKSKKIQALYVISLCLFYKYTQRQWKLPLLKFWYFENYKRNLDSYFAFRVSGQLQTGLEQ